MRRVWWAWPLPSCQQPLVAKAQGKQPRGSPMEERGSPFLTASQTSRDSSLLLLLSCDSALLQSRKPCLDRRAQVPRSFHPATFSHQISTSRKALADPSIAAPLIQVSPVNQREAPTEQALVGKAGQHPAHGTSQGLSGKIGGQHRVDVHERLPVNSISGCNVSFVILVFVGVLGCFVFLISSHPRG